MVVNFVMSLTGEEQTYECGRGSLLTIIVLSGPHFLSLGDQLDVDSSLDRSLLIRGREVPSVD